jgi:BlaI family penicillinase repressor
MNKLAGKIQDSELEVMRVLWQAGAALPLIEIRRALSARCGWEDSTIKTLLRRLQAKGIVRLERRGIYGAVITEAEYSQWATHTFLNKIFEGSAKKLVASLVSGGQLGEKDIAELSALFNSGEIHA